MIDGRIRRARTRLGRAFGAAIVAFACACLTTMPARADRATLGATVDPLFGAHEEGGGSTALDGVPILTFEGSYRHDALELYAEGLPPIAAIPSVGTLGKIDTTLAFLFATLRVYDPTHRVSLGVGVTRFENDSDYVTDAERDRSHLAGLRYELHAELPLRRGTFEASAIASPYLPGSIARTYVLGGQSFHDGTSETGGDLEGIARYAYPAGPGDVLAGVRYINFAARFPDGSQADRNRGAILVLGYRFRIPR